MRFDEFVAALREEIDRRQRVTIETAKVVRRDVIGRRVDVQIRTSGSLLRNVRVIQGETPNVNETILILWDGDTPYTIGTGGGGGIATPTEHILNPPDGPHLVSRLEMDGCSVIDEGNTIHIDYSGTQMTAVREDMKDDPGTQHKFAFTWDANGYLLQMTEEYPTGNIKATWTVNRDAFGKVTSIVRS